MGEISSMYDIPREHRRRNGEITLDQKISVADELTTLRARNRALTASDITAICEKHGEAVGTITIDISQAKDVAGLFDKVKSSLRRTDYVAIGEDSIVVVGWAKDQAGLETLYGKINTIASAQHASVNHVYHSNATEAAYFVSELVEKTNERVELKQLMMGEKTYRPGMQVYLTSDGSVEGVTNYLRLAAAVAPDLLDQLDVVFTQTSQFEYIPLVKRLAKDAEQSSALDKSWEVRRAARVMFGDNYHEQDVSHLVSGKRLVIYGYQEGKDFSYDASERKIKPKDSDI